MEVRLEGISLSSYWLEESLRKLRKLWTTSFPSISSSIIDDINYISITYNPCNFPGNRYHGEIKSIFFLPIGWNLAREFLSIFVGSKDNTGKSLYRKWRQIWELKARGYFRGGAEEYNLINKLWTNSFDSNKSLYEEKFRSIGSSYFPNDCSNH